MQEVRKQKKVFSRFQIDIKYQATHFLIPYRRPTWNSDVESFHNLIEEEFFLSEKPNNEIDLLAKTFPYQIWFNSYRNNRGRNNQNTEQIFPSELNTNKPIPVIPPISVDKYMQLIGKENKGDNFYLYHPAFYEKELDWD